MSVVLLPLKNAVPLAEVEAVHPTSPLAACDFYIDEIEKIGVDVPGGYCVGRVTNIDHHAPTARMARIVSSANLAIEWIRAGGVPGSVTVVLNHTDCDSVLSGAVMAGLLPPDDDIGAAAIAADHTGEENAIADMLQGLQHQRDFEMSLRNVQLIRAGRPLEPLANDALEQRRQSRHFASRDVANFKFQDGVAWAELNHDTDSEFFPALLPTAAVIFISVPHATDPNKRLIRVRLGRAAPAGFSLHQLRLKEFDPTFGGRWNAGSNKRAGGSTIPTREYVHELIRRLNPTFIRP
jgi:hypothetical protein